MSRCKDGQWSASISVVLPTFEEALAMREKLESFVWGEDAPAIVRGTTGWTLSG